MSRLCVREISDDIESIVNCFYYVVSTNSVNANSVNMFKN